VGSRRHEREPSTSPEAINQCPCQQSELGFHLLGYSRPVRIVIGGSRELRALAERRRRGFGGIAVEM
jgi:hypothetical protein